MPERGLERAVEVVLAIGLLASGLLMTGGLALGRFAPQRWGIIVLMATPALRLVVLIVGLLRERDWIFAAVSVWILGVLGSSLWVALRIASGR
ncbi:MAG TPA: DUF1634 domain-containing protein [Vicinamibacteria bacterium]|jgi:uncharacterized membrane protein